MRTDPLTQQPFVLSAPMDHTHTHTFEAKALSLDSDASLSRELLLSCAYSGGTGLLSMTVPSHTSWLPLVLQRVIIDVSDTHSAVPCWAEPTDIEVSLSPTQHLALTGHWALGLNPESFCAAHLCDPTLLVHCDRKLRPELSRGEQWPVRGRELRGVRQ